MGYKHGLKQKRILLRLIVGLMLILLLASLNTKEADASSDLSDGNLATGLSENNTVGQLTDGSVNSGISEDIDYSEIQQVINDVLGQGNEFDFQGYVGKLINGQVSFSFKDIGNQLFQSVKGEVKANLGTFGRLITIALIAALFTSLSMAFKNNQVSETGYYVTYLMMFTLLISTFISASVIASNAISAILSFMKALVPAYFMSVGFCTGSITSLVYYEAALMMITLVDFLIIKIVIPLINFYLIITLANNLSKEDMLSKLAGLFSTAINWLLKSMLAAVIGFHTIQGLIVPVADRVKRSALLKASEAIPGVGNAVGGVAETILSAGILLKNAIGVTGLVVILVICTAPFIKLLVITFIYKIGSAALQPVSDKRIIECISAAAKSAGMLLQTVFVGAVLFLLSITIVAVTTGTGG
ncbi:MAG TPA: stage III sporulation protein AE [Mobilitalea sp.]|nr:stage III sporulation protein AE [Mobilitalea sp.]